MKILPVEAEFTMRTVEQPDRYDDVNSRFSQFYEYARKARLKLLKVSTSIWFNKTELLEGGTNEDRKASDY
jgi:hypothetical protein